jgi:hypothetical protein
MFGINRQDVDFANEISKLIARAWLDNEFRERFIADPKSQLLSAGLTLADNVEVQLDLFSHRWKIEPSNDFTSIIFTIPLPPKPSELNEERLSFVEREGLIFSPEDLIFWRCICCTTIFPESPEETPPIEIPPDEFPPIEIPPNEFPPIEPQPPNDN